MENMLTGINSLLQTQMQEDLVSCNRISASFGLELSQTSMEHLTKHRAETLKHTGRIEFGKGILKDLVMAFCDSPYIDQANYEETMTALQELFYTFKNECRDLLSDDELIEAMRLIFNEVSGGSTDYIATVEWETMCKIGRTGSLKGSGLIRTLPEDDCGYDAFE